LGSFLLEFGFRSFLFGFCASFFVYTVATGKCLVEFARLIFLFGFVGVGVAQLFVWLSQFFVSMSAAAGTIFWWACGTLFCLAFAFLRKSC
jgi:ABC-type enterobactin transport system permease subunit